MLRGAAGIALAWLAPVRAAAQDAKAGPPVEGDWLVKVGDPNLIPLTPDDVPFDGAALMVWPMAPKGDVVKDGSPLNRIVLARLNPSTLTDATRSRAFDDLVAYSAVCTHSGCEVDNHVGDNQTIFCSCHGSTFDPRDSGAAIGGPASRALPALPLRVADGRLIVGGAFTSRPGATG